jgi:hypothetical protein
MTISLELRRGLRGKSGSGLAVLEGHRGGAEEQAIRQEEIEVFR